MAAAIEREFGFSLLELLVVLGLTSVLLTLAVFGHAAARERISLALAVQQVAADLHAARARAVARNREQRLQFTIGGDRYQPQERNGAAYDDTVAAKPLPAGIRIHDCTAPGDTISFRPQGGSGSFGSVTLGNASGDVRAVTVSITGRTRIR